MPFICIDIDNVVARTDEVMRHVIHDFTAGRVSFEYDHIVEFDYCECQDGNGRKITKREWQKIHELFSGPYYLRKIQPWPDVQRYLKQLAKTFDIHLATSRLPKARGMTIEWLEKHNFPPHYLHFLKHGHKHVSLGKFTAVVEDHYEQAAAFAKSGTPCFLLEHPWNRGKPQLENLFWVKNWPELTKRLLALPEE
jgi:5'(3')-deoxyribonucleotidase